MACSIVRSFHDKALLPLSYQLEFTRSTVSLRVSCDKGHGEEADISRIIVHRHGINVCERFPCSYDFWFPSNKSCCLQGW